MSLTLSSVARRLVALLIVALIASACGGTDTTDTAAPDDTAATDDSSQTTTTAEPDAETNDPPATTAPAVDVINSINGGKPDVEIPAGDAPLGLETIDLIDGEGTEAQPGDLLVMHYVGVLHENGEQFDASWDRGQTFDFILDEGRVCLLYTSPSPRDS